MPSTRYGRLVVTLAGAALPLAASAQLQFVTSIPGSFTDITGRSLKLFPSTEYQSFAPVTLGPRVANIAFPAGDVFVNVFGTVGYASSVDVHSLNTPLPNPAFYSGARAAAVYWDDMEHTLAGAGVYAAEVTENGIPVQIFQWTGLDHTPGSSGHGTFELKIFGGGGPGGALAQYIYQTTTFGDPALDHGASATIGYQSSGAEAVQFSFDTPGVPDGTVLSLVIAGPTGSCCIGTEACLVSDAATCTGRGGLYHGDGTTCSSAGCSTGACCTPLGCLVSSLSGCVAAGGVYRGDGSACASSGCPVNLVTNPGFETDSLTQLTPGWWLDPAVNGSHFVRRVDVPPGDAHGGLSYVMFGGLTTQRDAITQTLATIPGRQYDLAFWLWNPVAGQDSIQASWDNGLVFDQTPTTSVYGWTEFHARVTASGPTSLLSFAGYDNLEFIRLDDVTVFEAQSCYSNCDGSTTPPILNVNDFTCFLNAFAAGDPYANCDGSTTPPVLNVLDFTCFLDQFAAGCS
jgi:hypothetical protein